MKTTTLVLLSLFVACQCYAQLGTYQSAIGVNIVAGIPTGGFGNNVGIGYGIKSNYIYMYNSSDGFFAEIGYMRWSEKSLKVPGGSVLSDYSSLLLNAGLKINFTTDHVGPYIFSTIGAHFLFCNYNYSEVYAYSSLGTASSNKFNLAGGLGYEFEVGNNVYVDLNGNYNNTFSDLNSPSYVGVNCGLRFTLF